MSGNRKWMIATGAMLWFIMAVLLFNAMIAYETCRFAFNGNDIVYATLPAWFILTYIAVTRVIKASPRTKLALSLSLMIIFFALTWLKAIELGIVSYGSLAKTSWFTIVFSTLFTAAFMIIAPWIHRLRRRTPDDYIAEATRK
ncbi:MAG: hypothetical protein QXJ69_06795 [Desulfurococcaceae archaeon]